MKILSVRGLLLSALLVGPLVGVAVVRTSATVGLLALVWAVLLIAVAVLGTMTWSARRAAARNARSRGWSWVVPAVGMASAQARAMGLARTGHTLPRRGVIPGVLGGTAQTLEWVPMWGHERLVQDWAVPVSAVARLLAVRVSAGLSRPLGLVVLGEGLPEVHLRAQFADRALRALQSAPVTRVLEPMSIKDLEDEEQRRSGPG